MPARMRTKHPYYFSTNSLQRQKRERGRVVNGLDNENFLFLFIF
jgi:hypothetical protein